MDFITDVMVFVILLKVSGWLAECWFREVVIKVFESLLCKVMTEWIAMVVCMMMVVVGLFVL